MENNRSKPARKWVIPVNFRGRELDYINVEATTANVARELARAEYNDRGYYRLRGYTMGKPVLAP